MSFATTFDEQGFLLIPRLFDPAFIAELRGEAERQFAQMQAAGLEDQYEVGDKRTQIAIALQGPFLDPQLWANPLLSPIVHALLGPDIVLDSISVVIAGAGAEAQHRHRDHARLFPELPPDTALPTHAVSIMMPLIDFDAKTGTTYLSPGSHRGKSGGDVVPAFVAAGGCYIMHYGLEHWGSQNASDRDRPLLAMVFARPWFTDSFNFRHNPRINITADATRAVAPDHWPLFRRLHPTPFPQARSHKLSKEDEA